MILNVIIDDKNFPVTVSDDVLHDAADFFMRMDSDMDRGWQMSRDYIEHPSTLQRCQIAADKLFTAMHTGNEALTALMAGYILARLPQVTSVLVDTTGDISGTEFRYADKIVDAAGHSL